MEPRFSRARQTDGDDDEAFSFHCFVTSLLGSLNFWAQASNPGHAGRRATGGIACDDGLTASR